MYKQFLIVLILSYLVQTQWIDIPEQRMYNEKLDNPEIKVSGIEIGIDDKEITGGSVLLKFRF